MNAEKDQFKRKNPKLKTPEPRVPKLNWTGLAGGAVSYPAAPTLSDARLRLRDRLTVAADFRFPSLVYLRRDDRSGFNVGT